MWYFQYFQLDENGTYVSFLNIKDEYFLSNEKIKKKYEIFGNVYKELFIGNSNANSVSMHS